MSKQEFLELIGVDDDTDFTPQTGFDEDKADWEASMHAIQDAEQMEWENRMQSVHDAEQMDWQNELQAANRWNRRPVSRSSEIE